MSESSPSLDDALNELSHDLAMLSDTRHASAGPAAHVTAHTLEQLLLTRADECMRTVALASAAAQRTREQLVRFVGTRLLLLALVGAAAAAQRACSFVILVFSLFSFCVKTHINSRSF